MCTTYKHIDGGRGIEERGGREEGESKTVKY